MIGSIWDWIIVIAVVLILFGGASKIPELFRALGRAVGEFRKGQMEVEREIRQMMYEAQQPSGQTQQSGQTSSNEDKDKVIEELRRQVEELRRELEEVKGKKQ